MREPIRNILPFRNQKISHAIRNHPAIGMKNRALITEEITPFKRGRLHYDATDWFAISADGSAIEAGTMVDLLWRDGLTYTVQPTALHMPQVAA